MKGNRKLILLADDDVEDLELLEGAILDLDTLSKIHAVSNGKLVLDYLEKATDDQLPCLIVLDYNMPEMNGAEVLQEICNKARYKKIPKVIWSTSNNNAYIQECLSKGATTYFVKPATNKQLQDLAREMLDFCC
jgi:CheY-like chemotaxis protein